MATTKRRPDRRKICDTRTYTIDELATATGRTAHTVYQWISEGLPVADHSHPQLIFGYVARWWLDKRWRAKSHATMLGQIFCFGCQQSRAPNPDSLEVQFRSNNSISIKGNCPVCGREMHRGTRRDEVEAFLHAAGASPGKVVGFIDSLTSSDNRASEPSSPQHAGANIKIRGQHLPTNPHNERLKRGYFEHAKQACGRDEKSIAKDVIALFRFEAYFGYRDFGRWTTHDFIGFKDFLRKGKLTLPVQKATIKAVKAFLLWLRRQKGYGRKLPASHIDYLNLSMKDMRAAATAERIAPSPTPENVSLVLRAMPTASPLQFRNRALMGGLAMTGIRATAMVSLRLKHVDLEHGAINQNAREVKTKFSKHQTTYFMVHDPLWLEIFSDYMRTLLELGFSDDDPLFPIIQRGAVGAEIDVRSFKKEFMCSSQAGTIIKKAFVAAGLPGYTPHAFRHMWSKVAFGCSIKTARAISENLGRSNLQITHQNYGRSSLDERKQQLAKGFREEFAGDEFFDELEALLRKRRGDDSHP